MSKAQQTRLKRRLLLCGLALVVSVAAAILLVVSANAKRARLQAESEAAASAAQAAAESEAAAKAATQESAEVMTVETTEPETEDAPEESRQTDEIPAEDPGEPTMVGNEPEGIEAAYNVTGVRRKELVTAVGDFIGVKPEYLRAPTYAFAVGSYNIDKEGTLTGPENPALIESLKEQGFIAAE